MKQTKNIIISVLILAVLALGFLFFKQQQNYKTNKTSLLSRIISQVPTRQKSIYNVGQANQDSRLVQECLTILNQGILADIEGDSEELDFLLDLWVQRRCDGIFGQ
jgi:hypothetical protein